MIQFIYAEWESASVIEDRMLVFRFFWTLLARVDMCMYGNACHNTVRSS